MHAFNKSPRQPRTPTCCSPPCTTQELVGCWDDLELSTLQRKPPVMGQKVVDMLELYTEVASRGGFRQVRWCGVVGVVDSVRVSFPCGRNIVGFSRPQWADVVAKGASVAGRGMPQL